MIWRWCNQLPQGMAMVVIDNILEVTLVNLFFDPIIVISFPTERTHIAGREPLPCQA